MRCLLIPLLFLVACNGNNRPAAAANVAPVVAVLSPLADATVEAGVAVEIRYTDNDPDTEARTTIVAISIGTLAEIVIAANLPEGDGAEQTVNWDTTGVPVGTYRIEIRTDDGTTTTVEIAPGEVTVTAPPVQNNGTAFAEEARVTDSTLLPDGTVIVVGRLDEPTTLGGTALAPGGSEDTFVARYGLDGTLLWARQITETEPVNVDSFPDGSCVVLGFMNDVAVTFNLGQPDEVTVSPTAEQNMYLVRYDADGALVWVEVIESETHMVLSVAASADGSTVVAGNIIAPTTFNPGRATELVIDDAGVGIGAKYDAAGNIEWARVLASTQALVGLDMFADGSFVLSGGYRDGIDVGGQLLPDEGTFVARFDADGTLAWVERASVASGATPLGFREVVVTPGGDILLNGRYGNASDIVIGGQTLAPTGTSGSVLARYRGDGTFAWIVRIDVAALSVYGLGAGADESCVFCLHFDNDATIDVDGDAIVLPIIGIPQGNPRMATMRFSATGALQTARADGPERTMRELAGAHLLPTGEAVVVSNFVDPVTVEGNTLRVTDNGFFVATMTNEG